MAIFKTPPDALPIELAEQLAGLDKFHQALIGAHLERALKSQRVLSDVARETRH